MDYHILITYINKKNMAKLKNFFGDYIKVFVSLYLGRHLVDYKISFYISSNTSAVSCVNPASCKVCVTSDSCFFGYVVKIT